MGLPETAALAVRLTYESNLPTGAAADEAALAELTTTATTASSAVRQTGEEAEKTGGFFERNRSKIREFGRAGSELAIVASAIGGEFGAAGQGVGEFARVLGDAGLVASAVSDLGPRLKSVIVDALGLSTASLQAAGGITTEGAAAAAATPQLEAFGAAERAAAAGGTGLGGILAGIAAGMGGTIALSREDIDATHKLTAEWLASRHAGKDFTDVIGEQHSVLDPLISALDTYIQGLVATKRANDAAGLGAKVSSGYFRQFTTDAGETGTGLDNVAGRAIAAAHGLDTTGASVTNLGAALDALPREVQIDVITNFLTNGAGAFGVGFTPGPAGNTDTSPTNGSTGSLDGTTGDPVTVARQRQQAADEAARKAAADARAAASAARQEQERLAAILRGEVSDSFNAAQRAGDEFFQNLHDANVKAIDDALRLAQTLHDNAIQAANDALDLALAQNAGPIDAARAALQNTENQHRKRDLEEAVNAAFTAAQRNTDPTKTDDLQKALRSAREALSDFNAQLDIGKLQGQQAVADKAARDAAQTATDATNQALETAKATHDADIAKEALQAAAKLRAFNTDLADIEKVLLSHKAKLSTALGDITALLTAFGIKNRPPDSGGYKAPVVTLNNNLSLRITLNGRDVAAAIATSQSPSQSGSVRTGQNRP